MSARRPWAWPLVPLYRAGQRLEGALRERGVPPLRRLGWPVVSVGSLSAGGAGKTPVVIALAEMLARAGWQVDVLSRGFGRDRSDVAQVEWQAEGAAARFGDEPVLIAQRTGAPVWVGAKRFEAGTAAESAASGAALDNKSPQNEQKLLENDAKHAFSADFAKPRRLHLLDDGFQHRELARAVDIVLVTAEDMDDALLPAGNLREPLAALRRADVVVVRASEVEAVSKRVWPLLREGAQIWTVDRRLRFAEPLGVLSAGLRPLAFCAIARPEGFAEALTAAGCGVIDTVVFRDHARYGAAQVNEVIGFAKKLNASGLVTTEKDAVKLSAEARQRLEREVGPLCVVALDAVFADEEAVLRTLTGMLGAAAERTR